MNIRHFASKSKQNTNPTPQKRNNGTAKEFKITTAGLLTFLLTIALYSI